MLPSPRLIIMVLAAGPIFLAGALFDPLVGVGVIYLLALASYAAVDALLLTRRRQIKIDRTAPDRISLGVPTRISFHVHNTSRRRVEVRLAEDLTAPEAEERPARESSDGDRARLGPRALPDSVRADPPVCVGVFGPAARGTLEYRLLARQRGRYRLRYVQVRVLPAMGLFYRQFQIDIPADLHVFPNLVNLKQYELLLRRGLTHEQGLARLRQIGQGSEFESLRIYADGDDMSRVDWKATAKRLQTGYSASGGPHCPRLIVRNYQPERQQSVLVAIDVGRATAGEVVSGPDASGSADQFEGMSRLDYLVNASLMLAYVVLRQGDWFSLVAFSDRIESYLPPIRGLQNIDRLARALYELKPRLVEADYGAACRFLGLKNRKRSLICLMTDVIDRQASEVVLNYMARFARRHLPLAVTLADPEVRALAEKPLGGLTDPYAKAVALDVLTARREALAAMRQHGVDVLDVNPKALTPELINRYLLIKSTRRL